LKQQIKNIIKAGKDFWITNIWLIKGSESHSQMECTLLYAGSESHKNHIAHLVFKGNCTETHLGQKNALALQKILNSNELNFDLSIIEGLNLHRWFYKKQTDFFIPLWLKAQVDIPLVVSNRSTKDDVRRIRKNNLAYHKATTQNDYDTFYQKMYLPTMSNRHDDRTIAMDYHSMMNQFENYGAELLLFTMEDKDISGTIIRHDGALPTLWSTGILNGSDRYWKTGIASASYFFCSKHLSNQGFKRLDMGLSRAFLNDGVLQFKKKWNAKFAIAGKRGFILKINTYSEAVKQFLKHHPFAFTEDNKLHGAAILPAEDITAETQKRINTKYKVDGLDEFHLYTHNNHETELIEVLDEV
jgi:hypothetical protein